MVKSIYNFSFLITILITSIGCSQDNSPNNPDDFFRPNWENLNLNEFQFEFGDRISFSHDNKTIQGLIVDFSADESGQWYGICFIKDKYVFGRQIPSGFSGKSVDLLDVSYLNEIAIDSLEKIENIELNITKIGIGSRRPATNLAELKISYDYGIEQRNKEQTKYPDNLLKLDPVNECFFTINQFLK